MLVRKEPSLLCVGAGGGMRVAEMNELDENTLGRIADVVCDTDGPNHRQGWQLPIFFRQAGWEDVPDYREVGRRRWVLDRLVSRRHDARPIEQVLNRLSDPREYQEDPRVAQQIAQELNRFLALEGLKVAYASGRPVIVELPRAMLSPDAPAAVDLAQDLGSFIRDPALAGILRLRLDEASTCREHGACVSAIVMLGSVLEGALLDIATRFISLAMTSKA